MPVQETVQDVVFLAAIVKSFGDAIISYDPSGKIIAWNRAAEGLFGFSSAEAVGRTLADLGVFETTRDAASIRPRQDIGKHRIHGEFPVTITTFPVFGEQGDALGVSLVVRRLSGHPQGQEHQLHLDAEISERKRAEERFRLVVDAAPNSMLMVGADGRISLVNAQSEKLFGYKREELLGQKMEILVPERFRGTHHSLRAHFFESPTARAMGSGRDLFGVRKDGSEVPIEIGLNPIQLAEGTFVLASIIDITERKKADERFRLVVEAAPNAMIMVGADGRMTLVNSQTEKLFGYQRCELLGQRIEMLVPERFRSTHGDLRKGFFSAPEARAMGSGRDLYGLRKNGVEVPIEIGLNPISSPEGNFVLTSIIDITERKRAEDDVALAKLEAESRNKDLETMLHVTSHDLREPLRAIRNFSLMLTERYGPQMDDKGRDLLNRVRGGAERLDRLVQDILNVARARRISPPESSISSRVIVMDALRVLSSRIADTRAQVRIADDLPNLKVSLVWGSVAIQNLVANALKFTPENVAPDIEICAYRSDTDSEPGIMIRDRGIGVPMRHAERIFELFQRAVGREVDGTGAGLAIVKQIAERHGGKAWVQAREGGGSDFVITFGRLPKPEVYQASAN